MMRDSGRVLVAWLVLLVLATVGGAPAQGANPLEARLQTALREAELGPNAQLAVHVADARLGLPYVRLDDERPLKPASILKLITTAAALDLLGPEHRFVTELVTWGEIDRQGTLLGDLVIVGGGDPSLGPRFQTDDPSNVTKVLDDWARELRRQGIRRVSGRILGDDRRFANEPHGVGWEMMEIGEWYSAEVSALNFNDNCVDLIWRGGSRAGGRPSVRMNPDTGYVTLANAVRVGPAGQERTRLRYFRFRESNEIRARGTIPPNGEKYDFAAVHDPARFTAQLTLEALRRRGIATPEMAFNRRAVDADDPTTPALVLVRHHSEPLARLLEVVNSESQNLYAEVIAREVALDQGQPGSFRGAGEAIFRWLKSNQLHRNGFVMVDGSGLSPVNRVPARMIGDTLRLMYSHGHDDAYIASLAVPGSRTMRSRFQAPRFEPLYRTVHGKTGHIEGVHSIAGYVRHRSGTDYVFVIMVNDYDKGRSQQARDLLDDMVLIIQQSDVLP